MTGPVPEYVVGSEQYVPALVKASVDLTDQVVKIQFDGGSWLDAEWDGASEACVLVDGSDGFQRRCRTSDVVDFANVTPGWKSLDVQLTDTPEVPIIHTQGIRVVS